MIVREQVLAETQRSWLPGQHLCQDTTLCGWNELKGTPYLEWSVRYIHVLIDKMSSIPFQAVLHLLNEAYVHKYTYTLVYSWERNITVFTAEGSAEAGEEWSHKDKTGGDESQGEVFRERQGEATRREPDTRRVCAHVGICTSEVCAYELVCTTSCWTCEVMSQHAGGIHVLKS